MYGEAWLLGAARFGRIPPRCAATTPGLVVRLSLLCHSNAIHPALRLDTFLCTPHKRPEAHLAHHGEA